MQVFLQSTNIIGYSYPTSSFVVVVIVVVHPESSF